MSAIKLTPKTSNEYLESNKDRFVVLVFDAEFAGQKEIVEEAVNVLSESEDLKGKIAMAIVDVETNNDLASKFSVLSIPMIVCVKNGEVLRKVDNLEPKKLVNIISEQLKKTELTTVENSSEIVDPKEKFREYLKRLVNKANVMIFMKGDPEAPRCGFSRQLVEILSKHDISYETFDILQDEEVRQGLKEYSDWPTYPQIYVKGEFVGGLDILKQMEDSGELLSTMKV